MEAHVSGGKKTKTVFVAECGFSLTPCVCGSAVQLGGVATREGVGSEAKVCQIKREGESEEMQVSDQKNTIKDHTPLTHLTNNTRRVPERRGRSAFC